MTAALIAAWMVWHLGRAAAIMLILLYGAGWISDAWNRRP